MNVVQAAPVLGTSADSSGVRSDTTTAVAQAAMAVSGLLANLTLSLYGTVEHDILQQHVSAATLTWVVYPVVILCI